MVAEEFISVDPTVRKKTPQQRLKDLEESMKVATEGRSTGFARRILGKSLLTFSKVIVYVFYIY